MKELLEGIKKNSNGAEALPQKEFMRIHKSYIVRLDEIISINPREVKVGEDLVPVGRSYYQNLIDGIKKLGSD